jgi:nucleotide-binding universal stress UspA family protein
MESAMFSTVIVGYDGSAHARDALALGQQLCESHGGMLVLACAYPFEPLFDEELAMGERNRAARMGAERLLGAARGDVTGTFLVEGRAVPSTSVAHALTELAEEEAADLLVIGSTAHAPARRIGLGDVAMRLLHGSPCAVAVAPPGFRRAAALHHLGVAYDGSPEAEDALDVAYRIAREQHAGVTIYSVADVPTFGPGAPGDRVAVIDEQVVEKTRDRVTDAALRAPAPLVPETCVLEGSPAETISEAAEGVIDLLVMGSRGYGPIRRAVLGSVSERLVHAAAVPVLVTPRSAARHRRAQRPAVSLA